jgi:hypothetical protein
MDGQAPAKLAMQTPQKQPQHFMNTDEKGSDDVETQTQDHKGIDALRTQTQARALVTEQDVDAALEELRPSALRDRPSLPRTKVMYVHLSMYACVCV